MKQTLILLLAALLSRPAAADEPCLQFLPPETVTAVPAGFETFEPAQRDGNGDVLVLARSGGDVMLLTYDVSAAGWLPPFLVGTGLITAPDMAVDLAGAITVAWPTQPGPGVSRIETRRFEPGSGWQAPETAYEGDDFPDRMDIEVDASGNVLLVYQAGFPVTGLRVAHREHATGLWSSALVLSPGGSLAAPTIVANQERTHLMLFFAQASDSMRVYTWDAVSLTWGPAVTLPGTEDIWPAWVTGFDSKTNAVIDSAGDATLLWQRNDENGYSALTSQTVGGVWQAPVFQFGGFQGPEDTTYERQAMALAPNGEIVAVAGAHPVQGHDAYALHYHPATGWDPPHLLGSYPDATDGRIHPRVAFKDGDRAVAIVPREAGVHAYAFNGTHWSRDELAVPERMTEDELILASFDGDFFIASMDLNEVDYVQSHLEGTTAFASLGLGLAGTHGVPTLTANCDQVGGELVSYHLSGALENAFAFWVIGTQAVNLPIFGGTLVPSPDIIVPSIPLGPTGAFDITVTWPVGVPSGFTYYYQFWVLDPGAAEGVSASNALAGTTP